MINRTAAKNILGVTYGVEPYSMEDDVSVVIQSIKSLPYSNFDSQLVTLPEQHIKDATHANMNFHLVNYIRPR